MRRLLIWSVAFFFSFCSFVRAADLQKVGENDIKKAIEREFAGQGLADEADLEIFGGKTDFTIPNAGPIKIMVEDLSTDEANAKFRAGIIIYSGGTEQEKSVVSGKYYLMGEAWVPARNLAKGELIKDEDLRQIKVRKNRIKPQYVAGKESLVGQEAKKSLKEGKMVMDKDIGPMILIHKGDMVSSLYQTPAMQITVKCEALEEGAAGDNIEVMNLKSKKVIQAKVVDKDTVVVNVQ